MADKCNRCGAEETPQTEVKNYHNELLCFRCFRRRFGDFKDDSKICAYWEDGQHAFVVDVVDGTLEKPFTGELCKKCACGKTVKAKGG